jgi:Galactose oxidase, central domain
MVNIVFIYNFLFLSLLTITVNLMGIGKENFLSASYDNNYQHYLGYNTDKKLYDLIVEYRKKIFRNSLFDDLIKDNDFASDIYNKTDNKDYSMKNKLKFYENNFMHSILFQTKSKQKIEGFFNSTPFIWENLQTNGIPPSPRRGQSIVLADTFLILFGGSDLNNKFYNDIYFFDLQTNSWIPIRQMGNIPTPRADHSAVIYGTTMWIFGGASQNGYLNDLYSFNIETVDIN